MTDYIEENRRVNGQFGFGSNSNPELDGNDPFGTAPATSTAGRSGVTPNLAGASARAIARANEDLTQMYTHRDGQHQPLRAILASEGLSGRTVLVANGERRFLLTQRASDGFADDRAFEVSESTYAMFDAPDERSVSKMAQQEVELHMHQFDTIAFAPATSDTKVRHAKQMLMNAKDQFREVLRLEAEADLAELRARREQQLVAA